MELPEDNGRITVSRDKLRADLADLRDELKEIFRAELKDKADVREVRELTESVKQVVAWRMQATAGEFTSAQRLALDDVIENFSRATKQERWTSKSRKYTSIGLLLSISTFISGIAITAETILKHHG